MAVDDHGFPFESVLVVASACAARKTTQNVAADATDEVILVDSILCFNFYCEPLVTCICHR